VPAEPPTALRARIAALHARATLSLGRNADVNRWAQEAIMIAMTVGDPEAAAEARTTLAVLDLRTGDPLAAAQTLLAVRRQARERGHLTAELRSGYSLGSLYLEQGDHSNAALAFERP